MLDNYQSVSTFEEYMSASHQHLDKRSSNYYLLPPYQFREQRINGTQCNWVIVENFPDHDNAQLLRSSESSPHRIS